MTAHPIDEFRQPVHAALAAVDPLDPATSAMAWKHLVEIGVTQLAVPEELDGIGLGAPELAVVATELGRRAAATPFLATAVILPAVASTLAAEPGARDLPGSRLASTAAVTVALELSDDASPRATGVATGVLATSTSDGLLLPVSVKDGVQWVVAPLDDSVVVRPAPAALDLGIDLADVELASTAVTILGNPSDGRAALARARLHLDVALAADQLGIARSALETAVEYAKVREQFGAAIGSFQAIKHKCSEVLLQIELAEAAVTLASETLDPTDVAVGRLQANAAAKLSTEAAIHLHGGTGFTWEHPAHVYFRRARSNAHLGGGPALPRKVVARSIGL